MKIEKLDNGLRILKADEGHLIFRKSDKEVVYYEKIYLAKFDGVQNYGEVTKDYVYGKNYDGQIEEINNDIEMLNETVDFQNMIIESQSDMIDYIIFFSSDTTPMTLSNEDNNVSTFNLRKRKEVNPMAVYLARRILQGKLTYRLVMDKFPELKEDIDFILIMEGREDLID